MKRQIYFALFFIICVLGIVVFLFTFVQVQEAEAELTRELERRSILLSESLGESIEPHVVTKNTAQIQRLVDRFANRERLLGLVVFDNKDDVMAVSAGLPKDLNPLKTIAIAAMDEDKTGADFMRSDDKNLYVLAAPLHNNNSTIGSLAIVHNATYIDDALGDIWQRQFVRFFSYSLVFVVALILFVKWLVERPLQNLLMSIKELRRGEEGKLPSGNLAKVFLGPVLKEVSGIQRSLIEAQTAASYEAKLRLEKLDSPWTTERLKEFTTDILKGRPLYMVSNREPYIHTKQGREIVYMQPASGMVTALDPLMKACGGTWIAHGSGNADKIVVNKDNKVQVPPDEPKYSLRRIWLTQKEEQGYYYGFSNNGLWPLCHSAFVEPIFRTSDWDEYKSVNNKFAREIIKELRGTKKPIIFIQDYHFTLLPKLIKEARPDATVALFWHIPWPSAESFSICPWKKEILRGMLGADLLAFHTQLHCNNFIETVRKEIEALIDLEQFAVQKDKHVSFVKPYPISIPFSEENERESQAKLTKDDRENYLKKAGVTPTEFIGIGVDRLDYTKGIIERFKAIERFFEKYPLYKRKFTFLQIAPSTRASVASYQRYASEVQQELTRINKRFKDRRWVPIVLLNKHQGRSFLNSIYRIGDVCMVTSLHDGMNLVAKEFIAARSDERGVLILSEFTGASRELKDATIVNPYDIEETANAIKSGLEMSAAEQKRRMRKMREIIKYNNVYRWSAEVLKTIVNIDS